MGRDIAESSPELMNILETGSAVLGRDLKSICFDSAPEELSRTINAQPAIIAVSLMCFNAAVNRGYTTEGVAGHSLGEYAAMATSGMITLEDAFRLIKARSEAMDEAARAQKGAMAAIMKIDPSTVEEVCSNAKEYAAAVNFNSPQQTVIAGTPEGIAEVSAVFADMKARVIPLNVAGAFHSKLMQTAADKFYEAAKAITFKAPQVKYYSNVTGGELNDFSDMPALLAKHIVSPVRFTSELEAMRNAGADRFAEFGPGRTLTGLVKKTLKDVSAYSIENLETLEGAAIYE